MSSSEVDIEADPDSDTEIDADPDSDVNIGTANTMRERSNESRIKLWAVLGANRLVVTTLLAVGVFVAFVLAGTLVYPPFASVVTAADTIETMFSTMLGAIITGTTLVVTISQLVISQENGPLGEQHARMSETMDFREYTQELIGQPTPADPSAFLRAIINATERRAKALRGSIADSDNDQLRAEVDEFTDSVTGNSEEVRDELDGAKFGSFDVLFAALNYNYGWKIFQVERMVDDTPTASPRRTARCSRSCGRRSRCSGRHANTSRRCTSSGRSSTSHSSSSTSPCQRWSLPAARSRSSAAARSPARCSGCRTSCWSSPARSPSPCFPSSCSSRTSSGSRRSQSGRSPSAR